MDDVKAIADRVTLAKSRNNARDRDFETLIAMRNGDYDAVAPGLFNTSEFSKPLVANLIDTTARDIAETMAPLPQFNCQSASLSNAADQTRQDTRAAIINYYVQNSRLQDQMFGGADRYGSFGFMAYIAEPDFTDKTPVIRIDDVHTSYYVNDYRGRVKQYFSVFQVPALHLDLQFPTLNIAQIVKNKFGDCNSNRMVEVVRWYDDDHQALVMLEPQILLASVPNAIGRCPVRLVERPSITQNGVRGQFDDVIWVQIARALVQVYTLDALEQSVHAPLVVPKDVDEIELGPLTVLQTDTPGQVGRVNLSLSPGLFPESQVLAEEQRQGSRYPEGRSGTTNASIITGQGMQALMGTFDTQVQTFQRLNASALEDVAAMCFEMDERIWGDTKKTVRLKDNGAPRTITYTPSKDINGDYTVDVSYGAIAGLDPNRGLVFVLQALAGGLLSKQTAMKSLPVDMNPLAETRQIEMEHLDDAIASAIAMLPQSIPMMASQGGDPREVVMQVAKLRDLIQTGKSPSEAISEVFAPKQSPAEAAAPPPTPLDQAQGAGAGPAALPGAGGGGPTDLLMSLAGLSPRGTPNLQSNVSRQQPAQ